MLWDHHYSKINQDKYNNIYYINMAEIAIPIIALGSLYITSKTKKVKRISKMNVKVIC